MLVILLLNKGVLVMNIYSNITHVAQLIGDSTRMSILMDLSGMHALTAGELAKSAHVSSQTASSHLKKLVEGKLIVVRRQGKFKYYQLSDEKIAEIIESIACISGPLTPKSLNDSTKKKRLEFARTCYGHLAGELGVKITNALISKGFLIETIDSRYKLTCEGEEWFNKLGININSLNINIHSLPLHIDWTMRQNHLAGPLSLALTKKFLELGWIKEGKMKRELIITPHGKAGFSKELGLF